VTFDKRAQSTLKNALCQLKNAPGTIFTLVSILEIPQETEVTRSKNEKVLKLVDSQPHSSIFVEIRICDKVQIGSVRTGHHLKINKDRAHFVDFDCFYITPKAG
jgi:hypothetical protein